MKNTTGQERLLYDIVIVLFFGFATSLLLELLKPGFVSATVDLSWIGIMLLAAFAAALVSGDRPEAFDGAQRAFLTVGAGADTLLLALLFSLQVRNVLVALGGAIIVLALLIRIFFSDDRRRTD